MIKQATIYTATTLPEADFALLEALSHNQFSPCLPSQAMSSGWTAPNDDTLCEAINGQLIMQWTTETKKVPADVLKRALDKRCKDIEAVTGQKVGVKRKKEVKEELIAELIVKAFPARASTKCWINPMGKTVVIDAAPKRAAEVAAALVQSITGLSLDPITVTPVAAMTGWLAGSESPAMFEVGIDCELASTDESKTKVKYVKHNLDIPEIVDHITSGMSVKSMGLMWSDRVYFTLNDDMSLSKIEFLDTPEIDDASEFEADAYIATTDMNALIQDLIEELS